MTLKSNDDGWKFVQEYLYIEEYPLDMIEHTYITESRKKTDEPQRGVLVIDLLDDEESTI